MLVREKDTGLSRVSFVQLLDDALSSNEEDQKISERLQRNVESSILSDISDAK
jgi:hypothetical protein